MVKLKVKKIAEAKWMTMTKLSHRSEISFNTIKSLFRNPYRTVNTDTLDRLAEALEVTSADLIEYTPSSSKKR
jgi:DNA-binding Xre family transcriptional regulator